MFKKNAKRVIDAIAIGVIVIGLAVAIQGCSAMSELKNETLVNDGLVCAPLDVNPKTMDCRVGFIGYDRFLRVAPKHKVTFKKQIEGNWIIPSSYTEITVENATDTSVVQK